MRLKYFCAAILFSMLSLSQVTFSQQTNYRTHTVLKGETAYSIASLHKVSLQELYDLNPGIEKGLKEKTILRIPATQTTAVSVDDNSFFHSIKSKETLFSVSKLYDVPIDQIVAINPGLTSENFKIGNVIRIPKVKTTPVASVQPSAITQSYISHKVEPKETLFSLSQKYNVSIQEIAEANPSVKENGLKKGMMLSIPTDHKAASTTPAQSAPQYTETVNTSIATTNNYTTENNKTMKIGLLLPLLDQRDHQQSRFIEYYEGFLLAVQDIKAQGFSAEIYTFDISKGHNTKKLESLLDTYEMKNLDLIIGGVTSDEIRILNKFSFEHGIKYAIPFPVKDDWDLQQSPESFQVNLPISQLYAKAAFSFCKYFRDYNVIIIEDESTLNDKADFITTLNSNLTMSTLKSRTINVGQSFEAQFKNAIDPSAKNIVIPTSSSILTLSKIIPTLRNMKKSYANTEINIFGYPEWQAYSAQYLQDFYRYGTYIYSSFYADTNSPAVQSLMNRYRNWYGKAMINTYPRYGLLGYDTGIYFMTALARHGDSFENRLYMLNSTTLQSAFHFEKSNEGNGYTNSGLFFIHYKTDATIEKIDLSK
ncbi:LysM peptidoglycan-binding domain-containing protein [Dysgonomonas sp. 216]|uniref:muramidase family protein n=1 Tax=Dysgonomonas sp. 216 TaxID=2302934 RepID=UPI0013D6FD14|nr:LysM peptidoglycan-binding domain-containing protein [Dysgonomonas sp. 216]NDW18998.1 LysM peptidoglycan-binding domain-containing protein [Dysgonomonas sp. 216]